MAANSRDNTLRVRAQKILVEQSGRGKGANVPVVAAGFEYLEQHFDHPGVKGLLLDEGFTHYTASTGAGGQPWFLIEHVQSGGYNGGLNLRYDPAQKKIVEMKVWGRTAGR